MSKLNKYTKQDIIEAIAIISKSYGVIDVETKIIEIIVARRKSMDYMYKYFAWLSEIVRKYGDGKTAKSIDIPDDELMIGVQLQKLWEKAEEERKKLEKV